MPIGTVFGDDFGDISVIFWWYFVVLFTGCGGVCVVFVFPLTLHTTHDVVTAITTTP